MAEPKLTWQQKLEKGLPLNPLEEVKADADFHYKELQREAEQKRAFDALKNRSTATPEAAVADDKKGNK